MVMILTGALGIVTRFLARTKSLALASVALAASINPARSGRLA